MYYVVHVWVNEYLCSMPHVHSHVYTHDYAHYYLRTKTHAFELLRMQNFPEIDKAMQNRFL